MKPYSRADFIFDAVQNKFIPPARQYRRNFAVPRTGNVSGGNPEIPASKRDCQSCELKRRCYPKTPVRDVLRCVDEEARETPVKADTPEFVRSRNERKKKSRCSSYT
ncbi:hypothetical protein DBIPINDM_007902 (plasmid) [Mesorhizobium sp. AR02]|uniref:hypothetical protein n=1 Tax=Mesorhizobium sp. AR02 TaxID=2865837 RepID=UPI0021601D48|nr:hypothetical protein [Mesorhizobium sp. AR02]UVK49834.1 hypothetical protein DBIPINDM_007902 [Mesorhizobium sp. AR02]